MMLWSTPSLVLLAYLIGIGVGLVIGYLWTRSYYVGR